MGTVTKKKLIQAISQAKGLHPNDVRNVIQAFLDEMTESLSRGERLEFRDFGVFEIKDRAPRIAQNPKTLERVKVPAKRTVKFKVGRHMREYLDEQIHPDTPNGKASQIEAKAAAEKATA